MPMEPDFHNKHGDVDESSIQFILSTPMLMKLTEAVQALTNFKFSEVTLRELNPIAVAVNNITEVLQYAQEHATSGNNGKQD